MKTKNHHAVPGQVNLPGSTWTSLKDVAQKDKNFFGCECLVIRYSINQKMKAEIKSHHFGEKTVKIYFRRGFTIICDKIELIERKRKRIQADK
jgi:hypothetical protein